MKLAIIGGGPAGLRAAEIASGQRVQGVEINLFEAKPSVGRKFLVAGRGGLNLSKAEPPERFVGRYSPGGDWPRWLQGLPLEQLRGWAGSLGVETFVASTGRVYPREMKAAPLLRRWVERLRAQGVRMHLRHRWLGWQRRERGGYELRFSTPAGEVTAEADAVILALGGGSWPETGSDGAWATTLRELGVAVAPLAPANCGWVCAWPAGVLAVAEGQPLKAIAARAGGMEVKGELLVTRYGLEGGAIYQLAPALRAMEEPTLEIDFKPTLHADQLMAKLGPVRRNIFAEATKRWKLSEAAAVILKSVWRGPEEDVRGLAALAKACPVRLSNPRPIAEAISSAGGISWSEVEVETLMLKSWPDVFVAGEMIDWEAPTGGYLIHGCLAQGQRAAEAAMEWISAQSRR